MDFDWKKKQTHLEVGGKFGQATCEFSPKNKPLGLEGFLGPPKKTEEMSPKKKKTNGWFRCYISLIESWSL